MKTISIQFERNKFEFHRPLKSFHDFAESIKRVVSSDPTT